MDNSILIMLLSTCVASASLAQTAPVATSSAVLRQGTEVEFKTTEPLSSKTTRVGDRFELRSTEDVRVGSQIAIPAGSRAVGEVTFVEKKGAFGRSGKLDTRVLYAVVGDQHVPMAGKAHDQGSGGTVGTVAAAVLFWPVMPFVTGKSADFPVGSRIHGYVENDLPLTFAVAAPVQALVIVGPTKASLVIAPAQATAVANTPH